MRKVLTIFALAFCAAVSCVNTAEPEETASTNVKYTFEPELKSLVRNPMMGWALYDDANDYVAKASDYWTNMDAIARKYASVFYWRSRWSELEPTEGHYAWEEDENFKALIQGALDRGLHLAFRIYVDGQDNIYNATPDFVRKAGAQGFAAHRLWDDDSVNNNWTPYLDDPVFQEKFGNFIKAFAKEFDDPTKVDFIDGYGLGWWGEGHHLTCLNPSNKGNVYKWITSLYGEAFHNVILATNCGSEIGLDVEQAVAIDGQGYIYRKDSVGSQWFADSDIDNILKNFPENPFIGECCYWGSTSESYHPWDTDALYAGKIASWADYYKLACNDAIKARSNFLDLREITESRGWIGMAKDEVERFMIEGGYRFTPVRIIAPSAAGSGESFKVAHEWMNSGVGMCPNNNRRWNYKYKVAFALLKDDSPVSICITDAEPSKWLKEKTSNYSSMVSFKAPKGTYALAVAIIDTSRDNEPGIKLAVKRGLYADGWLKIGDINIK